MPSVSVTIWAGLLRRFENYGWNKANDDDEEDVCYKYIIIKTQTKLTTVL